MPRPKTLCIIPHFFGPSEFQGGSTSLENRAARQKIVQRTIRQIKRLNSVIDVDLLVYGMKDAALVPLDVDVSAEVQAPHILWKAFADTRSRLDHYEYFLFLEDDLLIPRMVVRRMMAAEKDLGPREILFPNRIEFIRGLPFAVDLIFLPEWTGYSREWRGRVWHEAKHSHSGMLFMSRRQLAHAFETVDFTKPELVTVGYYMDSAFYKAHRDFRLLREKSIIPTHFVIHQDRWLRRNRIPLKKAIRTQLDIAFGRSSNSV